MLYARWPHTPRDGPHANPSSAPAPSGEPSGAHIRPLAKLAQDGNRYPSTQSVYCEIIAEFLFPPVRGAGMRLAVQRLGMRARIQLLDGTSASCPRSPAEPRRRRGAQGFTLIELL